MNLKLSILKTIFPAKENPDRPKRGCFKCGDEGHSKADCPEAGGEDDKPR